ncbi:ABC transporter substrate-binding protein [Rhodobacteraceae bacterium MCCB 386]|nr:ABC transporter substrate-binding protein [Roseitranquillus sediminis]MBM9594869.1 ABC transporter substrate-binding protein [Roseitranquillus sediminis]
MRTMTIVAVAVGLMGGSASAEPVKVGMITTLSGGGAGLGIDVRDGFQLALDQAEGHEVELIVEDDQQKPDVAVQIADEMIQSEDVDILTGIIFSNLAMAVVPSATAQGRFYLSANAGPSQLAGEMCHENYFSVSYQNDNMHEAAGAHANDAGYGRVFIMAPNYPAGQDSLTGFKRFFEGEVAGEVYTQLGQTDYAAEIAQIRASDADAVFFFLPGGMGISFLKQYDQSGVELPLIGPAFSFSQDILPAVGEAALGARNTAQWSPDLDNAANQAFVASFREAYGRTPSLYASQGYDTANLILSALETAHPDDADAFRSAVEAADFESTRGDFAFGPNHHPIQDIYVREVVEADGELTNRIVGVALEDHADAYADQCRM